jgi:hypothetical protein
MEISRADVIAVEALNERGAPAAGIVAGALALDLDHIGAKIGENLPGPWTRENAGKFEHTETGKRFRHELSSTHRTDGAYKCIATAVPDRKSQLQHADVMTRTMALGAISR